MTNMKVATLPRQLSDRCAAGRVSLLRQMAVNNPYLLTYLLIYSMVQSLSSAPNCFAASQGFPRISRRFITALTSVRHLSLSWASPIQSIYPHPTSCRSILILSTHLRLGLTLWSLSLLFPPPRTYTPPPLTHTLHMLSPSNYSRFYHPHSIG